MPLLCIQFALAFELFGKLACSCVLGSIYSKHKSLAKSLFPIWCVLPVPYVRQSCRQLLALCTKILYISAVPVTGPSAQPPVRNPSNVAPGQPGSSPASPTPSLGTPFDALIRSSRLLGLILATHLCQMLDVAADSRSYGWRPGGPPVSPDTSKSILNKMS